MLWRVARRVHHPDGDVAKFKRLAVLHAREGIGRIGRRMQHIFRPGSFGQCPPRRDVIGMQMGVDYIKDAHSECFGCREVGSQVPHRIDDRSGRLATTAEEIRCGHRFSVEKLSQDHCGAPSVRMAAAGLAHGHASRYIQVYA